MTKQEAIETIIYASAFNRENAPLEKALDMALAALSAQIKAERNEPLTLEELREIDEEPVYLRLGDGREGYAIISWEYDIPVFYGLPYDDAVSGEYDIDFYGLAATKYDPQSHWGLHYSLGWIAHKTKPIEHDQHSERSKKMKLKTIENTVCEILETNPAARDNDMELFYLVSREFYAAGHNGKDLLLPFEYVMRNHNEIGIPCFESVRRTRQKIQAAHPELGCSPAARRARLRNEKAYRAYALDKENEENGEQEN